MIRLSWSILAFSFLIFTSFATVAGPFVISESTPLSVGFAGNILASNPYMTITAVVMQDGTLVTDQAIDSEVGRSARFIPTVVDLDGNLGPLGGLASIEVFSSTQTFLHGEIEIKTGWSWFSGKIKGNGWRIPAGANHVDVYPNGVPVSSTEPTERVLVTSLGISQTSQNERILWTGEYNNFLGNRTLVSGANAVDQLESLTGSLNQGDFMIAFANGDVLSPFAQQVNDAFLSGSANRVLTAFAVDEFGNFEGVATVVVPVPSTLILFLSGLVGLGGFNKLRRKSSQLDFVI